MRKADDCLDGVPRICPSADCGTRTGGPKAVLYEATPDVAVFEPSEFARVLHVVGRRWPGKFIWKLDIHTWVDESSLCDAHYWTAAEMPLLKMACLVSSMTSQRSQCSSSVGNLPKLTAYSDGCPGAQRRRWPSRLALGWSQDDGAHSC